MFETALDETKNSPKSYSNSCHETTIEFVTIESMGSGSFRVDAGAGLIIYRRKKFRSVRNDDVGQLKTVRSDGSLERRTISEASVYTLMARRKPFLSSRRSDHFRCTITDVSKSFRVYIGNGNGRFLTTRVHESD